ncbi:Repressor of RNA polymerase III transcription [Rhynchospora pubera]|uniref:Repressor of RNA polymerase III transcription n=1 Tax=Rhynchospora pubera TaxID=906938 RepID=A0AAV8EH36_9POAL|nr:Repressor of RNA polymerase III transcription [Rhynchospora pubera]
MQKEVYKKNEVFRIHPFRQPKFVSGHLNLGDCTIKGRLDAFSCKQTGIDRKLSISLEHEILDYLGKSSDSDPASPVDHLACRTSRKTLIYLVLTLGHLYPDYDFSAVKAHLFFKEEDWDGFKQIFDMYLSDASREWVASIGGSSLLESMTTAIDEVIKIKECDIYSYNPDSDSDPVLEKGALWSFNFFFYNRKLKRVVSLSCFCTSNLGGDGFLPNTASDEDDDVLVDMDM